MHIAIQRAENRVKTAAIEYGQAYDAYMKAHNLDHMTPINPSERDQTLVALGNTKKAYLNAGLVYQTIIALHADESFSQTVRTLQGPN